MNKTGLLDSLQSNLKSKRFVNLTFFRLCAKLLIFFYFKKINFLLKRNFSSATMASIEDYWKEACEGFDDSVQETWFNKLQKMYSDEKRTYHNLEMLREKLANYSDVKEQLKNSQAMLLAIFFQKYKFFIFLFHFLTPPSKFLIYYKLFLVLNMIPRLWMARIQI